jgi:hypothetical protein
VPEPEPVPEPKTTPKGRPVDWWADPEKRRRGRSTMRKWSCGCQIVRVGTKEFHAQCTRCRNLFECMEPEPDEGADEPVKESAGEATEAPTPAAKGWEQTEIPWPLPESEGEGEAAGQDVGGVF